MDSEIKLTEWDWKQPICWEKLSVLNLGQDLDGPHPLLSRLQPFADPTAILSAEQKAIIMDKVLSQKLKWSHADGTGRCNSMRTQHFWLLSFHQSILNASGFLSKAQGRQVGLSKQQGRQHHLQPSVPQGLRSPCSLEMMTATHCAQVPLRCYAGSPQAFNVGIASSLCLHCS